MIGFYFHLFNAGLSCDSVSLSSSVGEPAFTALTSRPVESCWSENSFSKTSDMFVCSDDGNLKYLQWSTTSCAGGNQTEASYIYNGVTNGFLPNASVSEGQVVIDHTCGSSINGIPCEIAMFTYSNNGCENGAITTKSYRPECSWITTDTFASFECCRNGGMKMIDYGDTSSGCSATPKFEKTFTEPFDSCSNLYGMFYNYNFQWTACDLVDDSQLVDCPSSSSTTSVLQKILISAGILLSVCLVAAGVSWWWKRSAFYRYKKTNLDERTDILHTQKDDSSPNKKVESIEVIY